MDPKTLFYLFCIPARMILVYIAYLAGKTDLNYIKNPFIALTTMIGIGFWTIYLKGWRKTGVETSGKPIWWNQLRPVHGSLYIIYSLLAIMGVKYAWVVLLLDVLIGLVAEIRH